MRIKLYLLVLALISCPLSAPMAQTWKPLCVNGGDTTGMHNNTWQKINSRDGATGSRNKQWSQLGQCIATTPPADPPPTNPPSNPEVCSSYREVRSTYNGCSRGGITEEVEQHEIEYCKKDGVTTIISDEIINTGSRVCRTGDITWR